MPRHTNKLTLYVIEEWCLVWNANLAYRCIRKFLGSIKLLVFIRRSAQ